MGQLNGLLNNRAVPTVEAVQLSFKEQSPGQQLQTYNAALQRFQQENTALFFMIYPSIDMRLRSTSVAASELRASREGKQAR